MNNSLPQLASNVITKQAAVTLSIAVEQGTQVSILKREQPAILLKSVMVLVKDLSEYYAARTALKPEHIEAVAVLIIETYPLLKLEEIAYAFKLAKLGQCSKVFGAIDQSTVMGFINEYWSSEDRAVYFEQRAQRLTAQQKQEQQKASETVNYEAYMKRMDKEAMEKKQPKYGTTQQSTYLANKAKAQDTTMKHMQSKYDEQTISWFLELHSSAKTPKLNKQEQALYREMEKTYKDKYFSLM